jgi:alkylhydroperoxidase/carboxymuconolactone decarboxylase family protein YurZ
MAGANGVSAPECIAAIRHLAPYVGYPTAAVALQQLQQLEPSDEPDGTPLGDRQELPRDVAETLAALNEDFADFVANQFSRRWSSGDLSPRERALACLAADVLNQTLDESFRCMRISRSQQERAANSSTRCSCWWPSSGLRSRGGPTER